MFGLFFKSGLFSVWPFFKSRLISVGPFFQSLFSKIQNLPFFKTEFGLFSYKLLATLLQRRTEGSAAIITYSDILGCMPMDPSI